jgi:uncharacterized membrane protein required for colicin V production
MKMGIILDLIVLAIVILSIILGYKRGLISVVFNLCAFVVSLIITVILYTPISNWVINNTEFDENIKNSIIENGMIEKQETEENDGSLNTYIQKYVQDGITDTANNAIEQTAGIVAEKVVAIIVAIGLFIVVRIAMILLKFVIGGIANLPIIKQFDKLGGTIYGVIVGFFLVYVLLAVLFFIVSVNNNETILNAINSSIISKILYANNIILNIIF